VVAGKYVCVFIFYVAVANLQSRMDEWINEWVSQWVSEWVSELGIINCNKIGSNNYIYKPMLTPLDDGGF
jgi:hypothetical protein